MRTDLRRLRLGFAGTPEFAVAALDALATSHEICAVFTQPDRPAGRGQTLHSSPVKNRAIELGLTVHQPSSFKSAETVQLLRSLRLDALVVVAYGLILPPAALQCPRLGCINIHASLLPRWRGAAPIQRALLAGDATTGVTIMRMEAGLDTGPMLKVRALDIGADDTAQTLHDRLATLGAALIGETLDELEQGRLREVPQPLDGVTYAAKIDKLEASIDWQQDAEQIWRRVRAFNPWPIAETRLNGAQVRVWDAKLHEAETNHAGRSADGSPRSKLAGTQDSSSVPGSVPTSAHDCTDVPGTVLAATSDGIDVACGRGVLRILRLQLAGRKPLAAQDFIRGQRLAGARFAAA